MEGKGTSVIFEQPLNAPCKAQSVERSRQLLTTGHGPTVRQIMGPQLETAEVCITALVLLSQTLQPPLSILRISHLSDLSCGTERRFELLLVLLVQLSEPLRPQRGACQSLAEDGVHRGGLEPARDKYQV